MNFDNLAVHLNLLVQVDPNVAVDFAAANRTPFLVDFEQAQATLTHAAVTTRRNCKANVLLLQTNWTLALLADLYRHFVNLRLRLGLVSFTDQLRDYFLLLRLHELPRRFVLLQRLKF